MKGKRFIAALAAAGALAGPSTALALTHRDAVNRSSRWAQAFAACTRFGYWKCVGVYTPTCRGTGVNRYYRVEWYCTTTIIREGRYRHGVQFCAVAMGLNPYGVPLSRAVDCRGPETRQDRAASWSRVGNTRLAAASWSRAA